jgi:hypothetical protein
MYSCSLSTCSFIKLAHFWLMLFVVKNYGHAQIKIETNIYWNSFFYKYINYGNIIIKIHMRTDTGMNLFLIPNHNSPNGHFTYHRFNSQKTYILPTDGASVIFTDLRKSRSSFLIQHQLTGFIIETEYVYGGVRTESLNIIELNFRLQRI